MPAKLLPASAAPFATRTAPNVVLNSKPEPWLTATLKRVNRVKRLLNSVPQHTRCLTETLASPNAIWSLCSLMVPKAPDADLRKDDNPLVEALFNYQLLHVEGYVVHVDMVSNNEVAFKLTTETIESLIEHHKDIFSVDTAAATWNWTEKEAQLKKLQEEFVQAVNRFVFRADCLALEGLEEDGAGELLGGRSEDVREAIMGLFVPLLPPPPRIADIVRPTPLLPSSTGAEHWWPSQQMQGHLATPVDAWRIVPSSPSPVSSIDSHHNMWSTVGMNDIQQLPSPASSYSSLYSTCSYSAPQHYSAPATTASMTIPQLPLPSMIAQQQCSSTVGTMGGFGWDRYSEYMIPFATAM